MSEDPETGGFRVTRQITKEDQAVFVAELAEYQHLCDFLAEGANSFKRSVPFSTTMLLIGCRPSGERFTRSSELDVR